MLNNTKKNQGQAMQILFSIILLLSLMISGLLTIVFGADVYEKINERATENFNSSTALSYVSSKVRQQDTTGAISVEEQGDISLLEAYITAVSREICPAFTISTMLLSIITMPSSFPEAITLSI